MSVLHAVYTLFILRLMLLPLYYCIMYYILYIFMQICSVMNFLVLLLQLDYVCNH